MSDYNDLLNSLKAAAGSAANPEHLVLWHRGGSDTYIDAGPEKGHNQ